MSACMHVCLCLCLSVCRCLNMSPTYKWCTPLHVCFFKTKLTHVMMESSRKCNVRNLSHNVPMCKRFMHCVFNSLCRFMSIHWFWLTYYHLYMRDTGVEMNQTRLLQHMSFIYVEICPEQWWWYIGIVPQEFKNILVPSQNIQLVQCSPDPSSGYQDCPSTLWEAGGLPNT